MPKLTPEQEAALNALQALRDRRLDYQGGYPAVIDGGTVRGRVLIADVDHDEAPTLTIYRWRDVLRWYRAALRFLADNPGAEATIWEEQNGAVPGITESLSETMPDGIEE